MTSINVQDISKLLGFANLFVNMNSSYNKPYNYWTKDDHLLYEIRSFKNKVNKSKILDQIYKTFEFNICASSNKILRDEDLFFD